MTDELITTLAKNHALRITSRTSVMRYKSARRPIRDIAGELGVDGVIVGSVTRSGGRVRINVQLIQASNDSHLWSESYERDLGDTLSLQDQLARVIADQVRVAAAPQETGPRGTTARFNPEAHDAYLRGRYAWYQGDYAKSRELFQKEPSRLTILSPKLITPWQRPSSSTAGIGPARRRKSRERWN
jgi:hypothetical protein